MTSLQSLRRRSSAITEPGEYRVLAVLQDACRAAGVVLDVRADTHFMVSRANFARWAGNSRQLRVEFLYRDLRRQTGILMRGAKPEGGAWNYDARNRAAFGKDGPGAIPAPPPFTPDAGARPGRAPILRSPGKLTEFGWPVTREQARIALPASVEERLGRFGPQHSLLSSSLNLKLLDPREVVEAAGPPIASAPVAARQRRRLPAAGPRFTSKPYAASGAYIRRMSNYCVGCRYAARSTRRSLGLPTYGTILGVSGST